MEQPLNIAERVVQASCVVALESSVLAQGLPSPANLECAHSQCTAVRASSAEPAIIGVLHGRIVVGAEDGEVERLSSGAVTCKVTVGDLPWAAARGLDGATTVSATAFVAARAGIDVLATGGIGGVHLGARDISADLPQLARTPLICVCSGPKHVADQSATLEWLETHGVLVIGYRTERLPAFLAPGRLPLEHTLDDVNDLAVVVAAHRRLGAPGAILLVQDPPAHAALAPQELAGLAERAAEEGRKAGAFGKARTPFELDWLARHTAGRSLTANLALLEANAALAGEVAVALHAAGIAPATPRFGPAQT